MLRLTRAIPVFLGIAGAAQQAWPLPRYNWRMLTLEVAVIAVYRVVGSLPVLRWAFVGGVLAIVVDLFDLLLMNLLHLGGVPNYQVMDKWLDQVYLALFLAVSLRWSPIPAAVALTLYLFRLAGFAVYEVADARWVLIAFPNVFEFWFLYVAGRYWWAERRGRPQPAFGPGHVAVALLALTAAKMGHEYALHVARLFDGFTFLEALEAIRDVVLLRW